MSTLGILLTLALLAAFSYYIGRKRSLALATPAARGGTNLHSLPGYYGYLTLAWMLIPAIIVLALWGMFEKPILTSAMVNALPAEMQARSPEELSLTTNRIMNLVEDASARASAEPALQAAANNYLQMQQTSSIIKTLLVLALAIIGGFLGWQRIKPETRARNQVESIVRFLMITCASIAILTTVGIVFSVLFESLRFFSQVSIVEFLFGTHWSPQMALRADQAGSSGAFGAAPLFVGTLMISLIALLVSVPLGLMSAIYLSEYASPMVRAYAKPAMEVLAGIPTVVYGFFAALTVAPFIRDLGAWVGLDVSSESALAAGIVMGVMIIPFMSSLSDDVINAVPQAMRDGSYGLGATKSETIKQVLLPAALPGIVGAFLLAASRAIGETMIVVMAAGLAANLSFNPLDALTTITVQIVTLLKGDQEFDSAKTLAAFALGLTLFIVTLILNIVALHIVRKYREQYE